MTDHGTTKIFEGLDFANDPKNVGRCFLEDDGSHLRIVASPTSEPTRVGVDSPFGTTRGFASLLQGGVPRDVFRDGYQTRETERLLRKDVAKYRTNQRWRQRDKKQHPNPTQYFNATGHVQPTVGLKIVPACHAYLLDSLAPTDTADVRRATLAAARRGETSHVEAHPRMLLFSAVERIEHATPGGIDLSKLGSVSFYKSGTSKKESLARANRAVVYDLLRRNPVWMGNHRRTLDPTPPTDLLNNDHQFDAWLAALTAWAHEHGETIGFREAGIDQDVVDEEGHILVLSQNGSASDAQRATEGIP